MITCQQGIEASKGMTDIGEDLVHSNVTSSTSTDYGLESVILSGRRYLSAFKRFFLRLSFVFYHVFSAWSNLLIDDEIMADSNYTKEKRESVLSVYLLDFQMWQFSLISTG